MTQKLSLIVPLVLCYLASTYIISVLGDLKDIGVCYGFKGDNLPDPITAVNALKQYGIGKIRLFEPNLPMQEALRGSEIELTLGVANSDIPILASSLDAAEQWFVTNVQPFVEDINIYFIAVGNEVVPGQFSESIAPAIQNLQNVLNNHKLEAIRATTVVNMAILANTYPPSAATFTEASIPFMLPILQQLQNSGAQLLINVYPYFAYASDPSNVRLDYAQFTTNEVVVRDGDLSYTNLFDAMVDSFAWAVEKLEMSDVTFVVSETGWPHAGNGEYTTVDLARTYNKNFMNHIMSSVGTPKRPGEYKDGFIFAMLDEDLKAEGVERNFGLFKPNLEPNYDIFT